MANFQDASEQLTAAIERWAADLLDSFRKVNGRFTEDLTSRFRELSERWTPAIALVCEELPNRGWYLSGDEPITLFGQLAKAIEAEDWRQVDDLLLEHTARLRVDEDMLGCWLAQEGVPDYTVERVLLVLSECQTGNHTVATVLGMTVVDELCRNLYDNRDFTTKRGTQPRPQLGLSTVSSRRGLTSLAARFVEDFGLVHEDVNLSAVSDENYFNRPAVLHGQMRRSYGPKDSAKIKLLLMFLIFGAEPFTLVDE